ncbi:MULTISPECIES: type I restriction enzyme HsdR N-terminal domain-containing protein [unclassified Geobacillus]|uniref:type I restriction enzyme HsdR N-terminal domain-containing protein n=1 Tax=unclassified Geobacillus TaxID=2642459 RepID=UPI001304B11B|nr:MULTISPECIES: type I restriction enzyme HsdR N-terminal domain-containing protein [unclassified Geobacillus]
MKIYKKNGKKFLYDMVKGILRPATPEEKVRQKVVKYLVEQMKIPIEAIETELLLSSIDNLSKLRADIVVWHINEATNSEECLLIIEVKAPHVPLTEKTLEQVMSYQSILKSKYVAITNGEDLEIYQIRENGTAQLLTTELYTYEDLINSNVKFAKKRTMRRLSFDEINYHRYINMLIDKGYIGGNYSPQC